MTEQDRFDRLLKAMVQGEAPKRKPAQASGQTGGGKAQPPEDPKNT